MLDHWIKCTEGDLRYVRLKVDLKSEATEEDADRWYTIYDDYINRYGLSKTYIDLLKCMKKLALLEVKYAKTLLKDDPDDSLQTFIAIEEVKLEALKKKMSGGMSIKKTLPLLSRNYPFMLRASQITFIEYQNILEEHGRGSKAS